MQYVVDASVVCAWLFRESHSEQAEQAMAVGATLSAPDLIYAEVGNVAWKKMRRQEIDTNEAATALHHLRALPLVIRPASDLLPLAFELAVEFDRSLYDGLYLALATMGNTTLVTADLRLCNALSMTPMQRYMLWIGDFPEGNH